MEELDDPKCYWPYNVTRESEQREKDCRDNRAAVSTEMKTVLTERETVLRQRETISTERKNQDKQNSLTDEALSTRSYLHIIAGVRTFPTCSRPVVISTTTSSPSNHRQDLCTRSANHAAEKNGYHPLVFRKIEVYKQGTRSTLYGVGSGLKRISRYTLNTCRFISIKFCFHSSNEREIERESHEIFRR